LFLAAPWKWNSQLAAEDPKTQGKREKHADKHLKTKNAREREKKKKRHAWAFSYFL
jgi:hypothetical protein